jgi:multisubunit Na+/H+ antiporter MnhC subunit
MAPLPQGQAGAAPSAEQSAEDIKNTSRQPLIVTVVVIGIALLSLTIFVVYFYARIGIKKVKERAHTIREGWDEKPGSVLRQRKKVNE